MCPLGLEPGETFGFVEGFPTRLIERAFRIRDEKGDRRHMVVGVVRDEIDDSPEVFEIPRLDGHRGRHLKAVPFRLGRRAHRLASSVEPEGWLAGRPGAQARDSARRNAG